MWQYIARRLLLAIPTLLGVTLFVFVIIEAAPGDVAVMMLGGEEGVIGNEEKVEALRERLGLNRPLLIRYLDWLGGMVTLDFGDSFYFHQPIADLVARKLPLSAQVGIMGILLGAALAIPGGIVAALKPDTIWDYGLRSLAIVGISLPSFWVGMLVIILLVRVFDWIPSQGFVALWEDPVRNLTQVVWPVLVVGLGFALGVPLRMMRATMLEVLREDYIRTARAKGLSERVVLIRHGLRNALIPVITLIALFVPITVGGLVVIETIFSLPGVGKLMVDAITVRDYPVVQFVVAMVGIMVVFANLVVDLAYGWLDPRIRY
jgi:peptide/nickel transport system permease protein